MRNYRIRIIRDTMLIETIKCEIIAEYRIASTESALVDYDRVMIEREKMYEKIDDHIANGGTLENYQW